MGRIIVDTRADSHLRLYIEKYNSMARMFRRPTINANYLTSEDRRELNKMVESDLSPENLTCDGELSAAEVRSREKFLVMVQEELRASE
jgi:hypothetical protein